MDKKKLLKWIVCLMFLMFLANQVALKFYWYYSIWWFDILMHFSGGFWVGLFFLYVFYDKYSALKKFLFVISCVLLIGILWEFFEFFMNLISTEVFSLSDTALDVFFDLFGGTFAIFYFSKRTMLFSNSPV